MSNDPTRSLFAGGSKVRGVCKTFACALIASLSIASPAWAEFSFQSIPELGDSVIKISGDGRTVVGSMGLFGSYRAAFWTQATDITQIGSLPGGDSTSSAYGVSFDGRFIVGSSSSANGVEAFLWSASGMKGLGDLPGGGALNSAANGVSNDGNVVVGYSLSSSLSRAYRWTATTGMIDLGSLGGSTLAFDVAPDGSTVVGSSFSPILEGFVFSPATGMTALPPIAGGARTQRANAVSADGKVVVGVGAHTSFFAFRWTQSGGTRDLGTFDPQNPGSSASAVSADGNVVAGMGSGVDADGNGEAFIWFPARGMMDLRKYLLAHGVTQVQGWRISEATGVSDDGRTLCGFGVDPQGKRAAWVARIDIDDVATEPPPTIVPASPANLSAAATTKQIALQWIDNANNETGFRIDRCQGSNCTNFLQIVVVNANVRTFIDSGRSRNTTYRYRIRAFNTAGNSAYSNIASAQTPNR